MEACILRLENPAFMVADPKISDPDTRDRMDFENATPIGCGKMGAMVYGIPGCERILLNEERIWSQNAEISRDEEDFSEKIAKIRALLLAGEGYEAELYAKREMKFPRICSYESAGELFIDYGECATCTEYHRELDLLSGIATVSYTSGDFRIKETAFASYPRTLMVFRIECDKKEGLDITIDYQRENLITKRAEGDSLTAEGRTTFGDHRFFVSVRAQSDGQISAREGRLVLHEAHTLTLFVRIATKEILPVEDGLAYDALLAEHIADFTFLSLRSDVAFGKRDDALESLPIPARLARIREGADDPSLLRLLYHFGRYLLISSSRIGSLPANLQGVWARGLISPWNADYHTNINLQMNYWLAEPTGLSECHIPLFDYMNNVLLAGGRRVAKDAYHCRGTVLHHVSDIYGFASAADGTWGLWPLGGAWLAYHLWEHYLFTGDKDFLAKTAYTYIHEAARFFLDYMFECDGVLLSGPSASPENRYLQDGKKVFLALSPTMDVEIISGLLSFYIEAERILCLDVSMMKEAEDALKKMPKIEIGKNGTIREWLADYEEAEPGHRHISHLFALYPGDMIDKDRTPLLFEAASRTIARRLANGGGHTGWSASWILLFYARLLDGEGTASALRKMLQNSILDNLLDAHPPFQIDGNFGVAAGIAEMLLQSHGGHIRICPALPTFADEGSFTDLCARGGVKVCATWQEGRVTRYTLKAERDASFLLTVNGKTSSLSLTAGETREFLL